jgi:formylglycine-generating enzyme required for sulfatase activity
LVALPLWYGFVPYLSCLFWLMPTTMPFVPATMELGLAVHTRDFQREVVPLVAEWAVEVRIAALPEVDPTETLPIPGGTLTFCEPDGTGCETEAVKGFRLDRTEVTAAQFAACVKAGACNRKNFLTYLDTEFCNLGAPDRANHPMNGTDWFAARDYCAWLGKRLPTLREWQFAARGEDRRKYPWGEEEPDCTRSNDHGPQGRGCGTMFTWAVGSRGAGASPFGIMDMAGNVMEWTSTIAVLPDDDPEGKEIPVEENPRTKRNQMGGSFADAPHVEAVDFICFDSMKTKNISLGIRCAE